MTELTQPRSATLPVPDPHGPAVPFVEPVFALHRGGKLEVRSTVPLRGAADLALAYTPGVARVCSAIADRPELAHQYTWTGNTVAVVSDGTAVLGLGDIGPAAAMPVMEGKALLFKEFAGVDAVPICLDSTDADATVRELVRSGTTFTDLEVTSAGLEDAFLALTSEEYA